MLVTDIVTINLAIVLGIMIIITIIIITSILSTSEASVATGDSPGKLIRTRCDPSVQHLAS